jgi:hypothetical protein
MRPLRTLVNISEIGSVIVMFRSSVRLPGCAIHAVPPSSLFDANRRPNRKYRRLTTAPVVFYQLALMTPGSSPVSASLRKQIRHNSNFLRYPRGRPQIRQRFRHRIPYFGVFRCLAIMDNLAIFPLHRQWGQSRISSA